MKIKLGFTDYFKPIDEFFMDVLSKDFDIERDDENPDYLIFCDENFGTNNLKFDPQKVKKIFYTGENRRPWSYAAHHAISFDHLDGGQFYRLPLYVVEDWVQTTKMNLSSIVDLPRNASAKDKTGFCSFVASNPNCEYRNHVFHALNRYKTVDSGGKLFNNIGGPLPQGSFETSTDSHVAKYEFIKSRKFNLCFENGSYPGYLTEKLFHALYANVVPIYWGSPTHALDFNPNAMISRHDFNTTEDFIRYIMLVDQNDDLYDNILKQPIFKERNRFLDLDKFRLWFKTFVCKEEK